MAVGGQSSAPFTLTHISQQACTRIGIHSPVTHAVSRAIAGKSLWNKKGLALRMLSDSQKQNLDMSAKRYHDQLLGESPIALAGCEYLKERGLGRWSIIGKYNLGVVSEPWPGDEPYQGMLVIPYLTRGGCRGLKFRCLQDHNCKDHGHSKYTQPSGQQQRLYNTPAYFNGSNTIGVCEGEIDAISASELLAIPTIGIPGATQWKANREHWKLVLRDFTTIIIFADGDAPGYQLASDIAADCGTATVRIVKCDEKQDVNSMCLQDKAHVLLERAGVE